MGVGGVDDERVCLVDDAVVVEGHWVVDELHLVGYAHSEHINLIL
jgi:type IV secretory pathway protease TraF